MPCLRSKPVNNFNAEKNSVLNVHECRLECDDIIARYIKKGLFVKLRRRFRNSLTVWKWHPQVNFYVRSMSVFRREKSRHLDHNYYMIHPLSAVSMYWEYFMIVVFLVAFIVYPLAVVTRMWELKLFKLFMDLIFWVNIIKEFCTGFRLRRTREIVMDIEKVAKNYFFGLFTIDVLSSTSLDMITSLEQNHIIAYLPALKVLRTKTFFVYLKLYHKRKEAMITYAFFRTVLTVFLITFWTSCLIYLIAINSNPKHSWMASSTFVDDSKLLLFVHCWYRSTYITMLIGYGVNKSKILWDIILIIVSLTIGYALNLLIISQFILIASKLSADHRRYDNVMQQVKEYMRFKDLPVHMCRRIVYYLELRYQKRHFKHFEVKNLMTARMRRQVAMSTHGMLLKCAPFLEDLPEEVLETLVMRMGLECCLPNDVLVQEGRSSSRVYFLRLGTVAAFTESGKEVCHFEDGSYFCEFSLISEEDPRFSTIIAISPCEFYSFSVRCFQKVLQDHLEVMEKVIRRIHEDWTQKVIQVEGYRSSLEKDPSASPSTAPKA